MEMTPEQEQVKQAVISCLRFLAASPKSVEELRKKLDGKGFPATIIEQALDKLRDQGVLDDSRYARDLVSRLTLGKAAGRHKISFELKRHGVPKKIRSDLLASLSNNEERERALDQARMKWSGWSKLDPQKRKKRLYDFLVRKGYDFQVAQDVLQEVCKGSGSDDI